MKKLFLLTILISCFCVGCRNNPNTFTVEENTIGNNKYTYTLNNVQSGYESYLNTYVFYKNSKNDVGNIYSAKYKTWIEKELNLGNFTIIHLSNDGRYYLCLNINPNNQ